MAAVQTALFSKNNIPKSKQSSAWFSVLGRLKTLNQEDAKLVGSVFPTLWERRNDSGAAVQARGIAICTTSPRATPDICVFLSTLSAGMYMTRSFFPLNYVDKPELTTCFDVFAPAEGIGTPANCVVCHLVGEYSVLRCLKQTRHPCVLPRYDCSRSTRKPTFTTTYAYERHRHKPKKPSCEPFHLH